MVSPVSVEGVTLAIGARFSPNGERAAFADFTGTSRSFRDIWLAVPKERALNGGRIWALVNEGECINAEAAREAFGWSFAVPNHPGAPEPEYELQSYNQAGPALVLGFDRSSGCLTLVIVDQKR